MRKPSAHAFSLVEVTLALGITAFCMVSLFGLLPIGLNTNRNSVEQTSAAGLASTIVADIRTQAAASGRMPTAPTQNKSPQYGFDLNATTVQTIYVNPDGTATSVGANASGTAVYRVSLAFTRPAQTASATSLRTLITWPAQAGGVSATSWPPLAKVSGSFEVITAVDLSR